MSEITTTARNADLDEIVSILVAQQGRKHDIVAPAGQLRSVNGDLVVTGAEQEITEDGVTTVDGTYRLTATADEGLAAKLDIPRKYLARMRADAPELFDANVNGWLDRSDKSYLVRAFRGEGDEPGIGRAFLSANYARIDNLDVLTAAFAGVRETGAKVEVASANLSDRRMYLDLYAPEIAAAAPVLLAGYRNPFDDPEIDAQRQHNLAELDRWRSVAKREGAGYEPGSEPIISAGLRISNSEVGGGRATITPWFRVQVCRNGLVLTTDAVAATHLGGRLEDGIVQWSEDTQRKQLALITSRARDAVQTFLSPEYLTGKIADIEAKAGQPVTAPAEEIATLGKALSFSEAEIDGVLGHFIRGGQMTRGGVLNAITSYSQTVASPDRAAELDGRALEVLTLA